ncbi:PH domain-containing protein [Agromyces italicus]|uniref:PH domain-containing protein n=1 Tax=Agromyces italicus TaxID=279572 RepID=UPI0003B373E5|nr:PH domain-containing protein [Agromyces italicus]
MSLFDPHIERHLIADDGEVVVDEVHKHWASNVFAALEMAAAVPVLLLLAWLPSQWYWVPLLGSIFLVLHGGWRILQRRMDRFVITNMRVFRVHGILSQRIATMPIARILDISVHKPLIGRIFNYGHFIFESAAQDQGLREIRFVASPNQRGLTIQRVIQRAGLRGGPRPAAEERRSEPARVSRERAAWTRAEQARAEQAALDERARAREEWDREQSSRGGRGSGRDAREPRTEPVPVQAQATAPQGHQGWLSTHGQRRNAAPTEVSPDASADAGDPRDQNDTAEMPWWRASN